MMKNPIRGAMISGGISIQVLAIDKPDKLTLTSSIPRASAKPMKEMILELPQGCIDAP